MTEIVTDKGELYLPMVIDLHSGECCARHQRASQRRPGLRGDPDGLPSMGRVRSCFDNVAAESFFSTLEHEVRSRRQFRTRAHARSVVVS